MQLDFEIIGSNKVGLKFMSLRLIQEWGIYYIENENLNENINIKNSLVITNQKIKDLDATNTYCLVDKPQITFYKLMRSVQTENDTGIIHPTAIIDSDAILEENISIGPYSIIGKCHIKKGSRVGSHIVVEDNTIISENCVIESHTTIGANGVAWIWDNQTKERIIQPQIGGCIIGSNCFIGTNVTIVRGSVNESTIIGEGSLIAHGTKIGHGCFIGKNTHFANSVTLAGNVTVGDRCFFGSGSVVRPMISIAKDTVIAAGAVVVHDSQTPMSLLVGVPAVIKKQRKKKMSGIPIHDYL
jgi:UDP-3-O-[3-hydroxymyristoyl] glucosamine N-acyltransferase